MDQVTVTKSNIRLTSHRNMVTHSTGQDNRQETELINSFINKLNNYTFVVRNANFEQLVKYRGDRPQYIVGLS